jgi:HSP20 family molecular chaperone IbpA
MPQALPERRSTTEPQRWEPLSELEVDVDSSKIEASLEQGVLTVRVPKSERAQRQKIEIKSK